MVFLHQLTRAPQPLLALRKRSKNLRVPPVPPPGLESVARVDGRDDNAPINGGGRAGAAAAMEPAFDDAEGVRMVAVDEDVIHDADDTAVMVDDEDARLDVSSWLSAVMASRCWARVVRANRSMYLRTCRRPSSGSV